MRKPTSHKAGLGRGDFSTWLYRLRMLLVLKATWMWAKLRGFIRSHPTNAVQRLSFIVANYHIDGSQIDTTCKLSGCSHLNTVLKLHR